MLQYLGVYTIRDKVAQKVGPLFTAENDAVASRGFRSALKNVPDLPDYELIKVCEVEVSTGQICLLDGRSEAPCVVSLDDAGYIGEVVNESK